ncbi:MAG: hypothetical protein JXD18_09855 [Anaerolineae bacterium]|nr:hypothetical protein [Anaerolineae bacterium]
MTSSVCADQAATGAFVVCGWGQAPHLDVAQRYAQEGACRRWVHSFGPAGSLFLYCTHRDVGENEEAIVLNLGMVRDRATGEVLSAQSLLGRGLVTPRTVAYTALTGNTLLLCVGKREPQMCFFRSVVGVSTVFYHRPRGLFVCSDTPRLLVPFLGEAELDPEALVTHLLFRTVGGTDSYLRGVQRLAHGHIARWTPTAFDLERVQDLRQLPAPVFERVDAASVSAFFAQARRVMGHYVAWMDRTGRSFINLLSGGIDSSVLQVLLNQTLPDSAPPSSASYVVSVPGFSQEAEYARSASDALGTHHEFVEIEPRDYPDLLRRTIETVAQPVGHESMPCHLALAQGLAARRPHTLCALTGVASDTLFGVESARRLLQLGVVSRLPMASRLLDGGALLLSARWPHKAYGARELARLARALRDPHSPDNPISGQGMFTDVAVVKRCLGDRAVEDVLDRQQDFVRGYFDDKTVVESVHLFQLVGLVADEQPLIVQMYNAYNIQVLYPYLDYELMEVAFAFDPRVRFFSEGRTKPMMKWFLQHSSSYGDVDKPKGHSGFDRELMDWMRVGVLRDLVRAIERPAFMARADFERKLDAPDWFTWNLLTLDLFRKHVLRAGGAR